ncbi:MAG TPA: proton-conducting transporter membrane subunit, partial [Planctomycetaceae bacterium]|nr:proton-conducting transporter membrane subunit [Planctomycetaceae bacterium]
KRLLAYSTIAHAGYMLMAVAAMMVVLNGPSIAGAAPDRAASAAFCVQGLLYYLAVYFFMNLGAFAIVALIRNQTFSEDIADYAGLVKQSPLLAIAMLVCMFSLIGMPPMGGFAGKFMVFYGVVEAAQYSRTMWFVLVAGLANTVFSLFYYVRVLRIMFISPLPEGARPVDLTLASDAGRYVLLVSLPVLALGIFVDPVSGIAHDVATWLFRG